MARVHVSVCLRHLCFTTYTQVEASLQAFATPWWQSEVAAPDASKLVLPLVDDLRRSVSSITSSLPAALLDPLSSYTFGQARSPQPESAHADQLRSPASVSSVGSEDGSARRLLSPRAFSPLDPARSDFGCASCIRTLNPAPSVELG
jgi:hypothetical protein